MRSLIKPPGQQPNPNISPKGESTQESNSSNDLSPLSAKSPHPPQNAETTRKRYRYKTPWLKILFDGSALLLGALTLIVLSIYACDTHRMWQEMQEQTRIQRNTGINAQRAWVGLDAPITLDAVEISPMAIRIDGHYTIKNFGQGPALKVIQFGNFVDLDATEEIQKREADSYCDGAVKFTGGTVPVGGELEQPPPFGYTLFPDQWHPEIIQVRGKELPKKTARFMRFIGCVAYLDQFREIHWARFCMERKPDDLIPVGKIPKLDFCAMYNDTDAPKQ
jgi:hypothetical protein